MKRCPECDFSFVDFYRVCDFDGTDLVDDPETLPVSPAVSALAATQSPFLRLVKSSDFLIGLALAGLVSSAFLIGYLDAATQPNSIAKSPAPRDSPSNYIASLAPPAQPPAQPSAQPPAQPSVRIATRAPSTRFLRGRRTGSWRQSSSLLTAHSPLPTAHSQERLHTSPSTRNQQGRPEIALQSQPKDRALQKESKESALHRDSKDNANRKDSKLTATLKTTWRILKKPFKF